MITKASITIGQKEYLYDPSQAIDISMPLRLYTENASCYWAEPVKASTIRSGSFVGSVAEGGSCNYQQLTLTPHGNGTHTECYGHISSNKEATINNCLAQFLFFAKLITIAPELRDNGDLVITFSSFITVLGDSKPEAVIIRTLPNDNSKLTRQYSGTNPPYLEAEIAAYLAAANIKHLLVDLPSLDKEQDNGVLAAHHAFWQYPDATRKDATITELIYINDRIADGNYLLQMQVLNLEMDASPSRPIIYQLSEKIGGS